MHPSGHPHHWATRQRVVELLRECQTSVEMSQWLRYQDQTETIHLINSILFILPFVEFSLSVLLQMTPPKQDNINNVIYVVSSIELIDESTKRL